MEKKREQEEWIAYVVTAGREHCSGIRIESLIKINTISFYVWQTESHTLLDPPSTVGNGLRRFYFL